MTFDVRPFWLIGALCGGVFGLVVLFVRRGYPNYLRWTLEFLGLANLCLAASYVARLSGPWMGRFVFDVLSSTLVVACLSLEYRAICELKQRLASAAWIMGPPLLTFLLCSWFAFVHRNITIQLFLVNAIDMTMMFLLARTLWRPEGGKKLPVDILTAISYSLLGLVTFAVVIDYFRTGVFSVEYNFNTPRSMFNNVAAIITEGVVFPLYLLMVSNRQNRDLMVQAMRDPLTGLYNRRAFEDISFRELSGAARTGFGLALLIFDIDHLKKINDTQGHAAGDAVIVAAAAALRASLRDEDYLCRWGGDEFCALLPRASREQAEDVAERAHWSLQNLDFHHEGKAIEISVSTGIVTNEGRIKELASLMKSADAAMYRAKQEGRNRFAMASN
jgi:diguanylate cyclase (GGDEF)-like protein